MLEPRSLTAKYLRHELSIPVQVRRPGVLQRIRKLAELKRDHITASTVAPRLTERPDIDLVEAVNAFGRWFASVTPERQTGEILSELEATAAFS